MQQLPMRDGATTTSNTLSEFDTLVHQLGEIYGRRCSKIILFQEHIELKSIHPLK